MGLKEKKSTKGGEKEWEGNRRRGERKGGKIHEGGGGKGNRKEEGWMRGEG